MMKNIIEDYFAKSIEAKKRFLENYRDEISNAAAALTAILKRGNKILVFGNGGSAADSQHIAAELIGRFKKERKPYAVIALTTNTSTLTALANDYSFEDVFVRQVEALFLPGDGIIAISTSGNSANVIKAAEYTRNKKGYVLSFSGEDGGSLARVSDLCFKVAAGETSIIQEVHITLAHILCLLIEENLT